MSFGLRVCENYSALAKHLKNAISMDLEEWGKIYPAPQQKAAA